MKKEKLLISLVLIVMLTLVVGNVYSLATEGGTLKITANTDSAANNTTTNGTSNNTAVPGVLSGTNSTANNSTTNNTTKTNTASNTSLNTVKESSLPKAGTDSKVVLLVLAFVVSAVYAYKKVSDYNI